MLCGADHEIFLDIAHIYIEYGKGLGIFHGILLVPHNIVMNLNNVMGCKAMWNSCIALTFMSYKNMNK